MRHTTRVAAGAFIAAAAVNTLAAHAQLVPDRIYYGVDRPIPMRVSVPARGEKPADGSDADRPKVEIHLLQPGTAKAIARATVVIAPIGEAGRVAGNVDLSQLFPTIWSSAATPRPGADFPASELMYAQLLVGEAKLGAPVVLQPMASPVYAPRVDRAGAPAFAPERERTRVFSGYRAYVQQDVELETTAGRMLVQLRPESAPNTCWRVRELVAGGFYTDVIVHRIASLAGKPEADIIQTGDPNGTGQGGCGEFIDLEPSTLPHDFGVVSMARFSDVNSASSQFMIGLNREGTAYLDRRYTSFGVLIDGAEVLRAIAATPVGADNRPKASPPPMINRARLVDAAPYGTGPGPVRDPARKNGR